MFDLKKFLRIEISGYVCILYTALFTACLFFLFRPGFGIEEFDSGFWYKGPIAAIPVALVLGFIIHQLSITLLSPFCENRTWFGKRTVLKSLKKHLRSSPKYYRNILEAVDKNGLFDALAGRSSSKNLSYSEYLRGEISRRYSYYYARIDAGAFAPLLGLTLSLLFYLVFILDDAGDVTRLLEWNTFARLIPLEVSVLLALIISAAIVRYCRKLFGEIDVLECAILAENYDYRFIKGILKKYEAGMRENL